MIFNGVSRLLLQLLNCLNLPVFTLDSFFETRNFILKALFLGIKLFFVPRLKFVCKVLELCLNSLDHIFDIELFVSYVVYTGLDIFHLFSRFSHSLSGYIHQLSYSLSELFNALVGKSSDVLIHLLELNFHLLGLVSMQGLIKQLLLSPIGFLNRIYHLLSLLSILLSPLLLISLVFILDLITDLTCPKVLRVGQGRLQVRNGYPESVGKLPEFIAYYLRKFLIIFQLNDFSIVVSYDICKGSKPLSS